jgi:hypothetical protein
VIQTPRKNNAGKLEETAVRAITETKIESDRGRDCHIAGGVTLGDGESTTVLWEEDIYVLSKAYRRWKMYVTVYSRV